MDSAAGEWCPMRGQEPLGIEDGGDLAIHHAGAVQRQNPTFQQFGVGAFSIAPYRMAELVLAGGAGLPGDAHRHQAAFPLLIEHDLSYHEAQDALSLLCRRVAPDALDILCHVEYLAALALRERSGLGTAPGFVGLLDRLDVAQTLLPGPLQRTR